MYYELKGVDIYLFYCTFGLEDDGIITGDKRFCDTLFLDKCYILYSNCSFRIIFLNFDYLDDDLKS